MESGVELGEIDVEVRLTCEALWFLLDSSERESQIPLCICDGIIMEC